MNKIEFKKINDWGERFIVAYFNLLTTSSKKDNMTGNEVSTVMLTAQAQAQALTNKYNIVSATINGKSIGSISYTPAVKGYSIRIDTLSILPMYQRKGIGKALVNFVLNENKNKPISVSAFIENKIAVFFWNSLREFKRIKSTNTAEICFSTKPKSNKTFITVSPTKEMVERVIKNL